MCHKDAMRGVSQPITRGSTSYTCLINRAQACFAAEVDTSPNSSKGNGSSPFAFRRFPRLTLL